MKGSFLLTSGAFVFMLSQAGCSIALERSISEVTKDLSPPIMLTPQENRKVSNYSLSFSFQRQSSHGDNENASWSIGTY